MPEALVIFSGPDAYISPNWYPFVDCVIEDLGSLPAECDRMVAEIVTARRPRRAPHQ